MEQKVLAGLVSRKEVTCSTMTVLACTWPVPILIMGAPSCHFRYSLRAGSYFQTASWSGTVMAVAGAPVTAASSCLGVISYCGAGTFFAAAKLVSLTPWIITLWGAHRSSVRKKTFPWP